MKRFVLVTLAVAPLLAQEAAPLRPPAAPLIAHDPYFSVWSTADRLNQEVTKHWTGTEQPITGLIRVDGKVLRFLGGPARWTVPVPLLQQISQRLTPTRTLYTFAGEGIELDLTFLTPALAGDTSTARQRGFQARSFVGGVFVKMLSDPAMWKKWASQGR